MMLTRRVYGQGMAEKVALIDLVVIDVDKRKIDLMISDAELAARKAAWKPRPTDYNAGAIWKHA